MGDFGETCPDAFGETGHEGRGRAPTSEFISKGGNKLGVGNEDTFFDGEKRGWKGGKEASCEME